MGSNPVVPGGSLMSKPTWSNTSGYSATSAFLLPVLRDSHNDQGSTLANLKKGGLSCTSVVGW